jgi:hypothetical protein
VTLLLGGPAGFELVFLSGDGAKQRVSLEEAWRVLVEDGLPDGQGGGHATGTC